MGTSCNIQDSNEGKNEFYSRGKRLYRNSSSPNSSLQLLQRLTASYAHIYRYRDKENGEESMSRTQTGTRGNAQLSTQIEGTIERMRTTTDTGRWEKRAIDTWTDTGTNLYKGTITESRAARTSCWYALQLWPRMRTQTPARRAFNREERRGV